MELKRVNDSTLRNWIDQQDPTDIAILCGLLIGNMGAWFNYLFG